MAIGKPLPRHLYKQNPTGSEKGTQMGIGELFFKQRSSKS
jgi:hypothetical protein